MYVQEQQGLCFVLANMNSKKEVKERKREAGQEITVYTCCDVSENRN